MHRTSPLMLREWVVERFKCCIGAQIEWMLRVATLGHTKAIEIGCRPVGCNKVEKGIATVASKGMRPPGDNGAICGEGGEGFAHTAWITTGVVAGEQFFRVGSAIGEKVADRKTLVAPPLRKVDTAPDGRVVRILISRRGIEHEKCNSPMAKEPAAREGPTVRATGGKVGQFFYVRLIVHRALLGRDTMTVDVCVIRAPSRLPSNYLYEVRPLGWRVPERYGVGAPHCRTIAFLESP